MDESYAVIESGEGEPLLLLHGYLSCKESFYYQIECLSKGRRVVAVDLPGFGKTPEPDKPFSLSDYVEFTRMVINERCSGRADVLAHSFGGRIALKLMAEGKGEIGRALLTGCAGLKPKRTARYYAKSIGYKLLKRACPSVAEKNISRFASKDYLALSPTMRQSFKLIVNEHLDGLLCKIKTPTLLVFGKGDRETPVYMAKKLNEGIAGSGLVFLDGGHFCFVEGHLGFNAVAKEFFF